MSDKSEVRFIIRGFQYLEWQPKMRLLCNRFFDNAIPFENYRRFRAISLKNTVGSKNQIVEIEIEIAPDRIT